MSEELDSLLHTARLLATKQEQERIIKLLEDKQLNNCKYMGCSLDPLSLKMSEEDGHDYDCGSWATHQTIVLIKGKAE